MGCLGLTEGPVAARVCWINIMSAACILDIDQGDPVLVAFAENVARTLRPFLVRWAALGSAVRSGCRCCAASRCAHHLGHCEFDQCAHPRHAGADDREVELGSAPVAYGSVVPWYWSALRLPPSSLRRDSQVKLELPPNCTSTCSRRILTIVTTAPMENIRKTKNFLRLFSCSLLITGSGRIKIMTSRITLKAADVQPCALMSLQVPWCSPSHVCQARLIGLHWKTETSRKAIA